MCDTNKPITAVDKDKIIGEAKGLVDTIFRAAENCDPAGLTATLLDSPDFVSLINGVYDDYENTVNKYPALMSDFASQKGTITGERYIVLDASTVLFTSISRWDCRLKNGSAAVFEPAGLHLLLKKADDRWRVLSWIESF